MNDISLLKEAYDKVLKRNLREDLSVDTISPEMPVQASLAAGPETTTLTPALLDSPMDKEESEVHDMVIAKLLQIQSEANEALNFVKSGKTVESWMFALVELAADKVSTVKNHLEFSQG
jgi:hypothetical protein